MLEVIADRDRTNEFIIHGVWLAANDGTKKNDCIYNMLKSIFLVCLAVSALRFIDAEKCIHIKMNFVGSECVLIKSTR